MSNICVYILLFCLTYKTCYCTDKTTSGIIRNFVQTSHNNARIKSLRINHLNVDCLVVLLVNSIYTYDNYEPLLGILVLVDITLTNN